VVALSYSSRIYPSGYSSAYAFYSVRSKTSKPLHVCHPVVTCATAARAYERQMTTFHTQSPSINCFLTAPKRAGKIAD